MTSAVLEKAELIRNNAIERPRIGVTEFARSKKWRSELERCGALEIIDRNETTGYVLSPDGMKSLLDAIDTLEEEIERMQIDAIFAARPSAETVLSGDELEQEAVDRLRSRKNAIRQALDGD